jgi:putative membrane protein (TIGR04086 family)
MEKISKDNKFINILKGVGISMLTTCISLIIFAILLTYTNISETTITPVIIVITAISILLGSSIINIKIKRNGLLNGALVGGIYLAIIYLISSILNWDFGLNMQSIIMIIIAMIFGMLGGIIGVNKKID